VPHDLLIVRSDGYADYVAQLRRRCGSGEAWFCAPAGAIAALMTAVAAVRLIGANGPHPLSMSPSSCRIDLKLLYEWLSRPLTGQPEPWPPAEC
jgi:hypothetical protein